MYELIRTETRPSIDVPFYIHTASVEDKQKLAAAIMANGIQTEELYSSEALVRTAKMTAVDEATFKAFLDTPDLALYFAARDAYNVANSIDVSIAVL